MKLFYTNRRSRLIRSFIKTSVFSGILFLFLFANTLSAQIFPSVGTPGDDVGNPDAVISIDGTVANGFYLAQTPELCIQGDGTNMSGNGEDPEWRMDLTIPDAAQNTPVCNDIEFRICRRGDFGQATEIVFIYDEQGNQIGDIPGHPADDYAFDCTSEPICTIVKIPPCAYNYQTSDGVYSITLYTNGDQGGNSVGDFCDSEEIIPGPVLDGDAASCDTPNCLDYTQSVNGVFASQNNGGPIVNTGCDYCNCVFLDYFLIPIEISDSEFTMTQDVGCDYANASFVPNPTDCGQEWSVNGGTEGLSGTTGNVSFSTTDAGTFTICNTSGYSTCVEQTCVDIVVQGELDINCPPNINTTGCTTGDLANGISALSFSSDSAPISEAQFLAEGGQIISTDPINSITYQDLLVGNGCPMTIERTFQISAGTTGAFCNFSCTQSITLNDSTPPQINCDNINDLELECDGDYSSAISTWLAGIETSIANSVNDDCNVSIENNYNGGTLDLVCDNSTAGLTVVFTLTDDCNNVSTCSASITLQDTVAPLVSCPPVNNSLGCGDPLPATFTDVNDFISAGGVVTEYCGGGSAANVSISLINEVDNGGSSCTEDLIITRTYQFTDPCGNSITCDHVIEYQADNQAPVTDCPSIEIALECGVAPPPAISSINTFIDQIGAVSDACNDLSDLSINFEDDYTIADVCPIGTASVITRTYTISDACGNSAECQQLFIYDEAVSSLNIEKTLIDGPTVQNNGTYNMTFNVFLQNDGNLNLSNIQIVDDLSAFAPVNNAILANVSANLQTNFAYDGINIINTLSGNNTLAVNEMASFDLVINVGPYASPPTDLINSIVANTSDPEGNVIEYVAEAATEFPEQIAELGLSKLMTNGPALNSDGTYDIIMRIVAENMGNIELTNLQLQDNLLTTFGETPINSVDIVNNSNNINTNIFYDGQDNINLLFGNDVLAAGEIAFVDIAINFGPEPFPGGTTYYNTAQGIGLDPGGNEIIDLSHNGADPDPENDGPGNNNEPSPIMTTLPNGQIGIAKELSDISDLNPDGTYDIVYTLYVQNMGEVNIDNIQIMDNLATTFIGPPTVPINDVSLAYASSNLSPNGSYNGVSDPNLLLGFDSFEVDETGSIQILVNIGPVPQPGGTYNNQAFVSGVVPSGAEVSDISTNGTNPDPNNNGPGDDNEYTSIELEGAIAEISVDKILSQPPVLNTDGSYDLTYTILVQNTGNIDLENLQMTDNLSAFEPINTVNLSMVSPNLSPNLFFNGLDNQNLLIGGDNLSVGEQASLNLVLNVGPYTSDAPSIGNTVNVSANDVVGNEVDADDSSDDATFETANPALTLLKQLSSGPNLNSDGTYDISYYISISNTGNIDINDLQIIDELSAFEPLNSVEILNPSSNINTNLFYNGLDETNMLSANNSLGAGENAYLSLQINAGPYSEGGSISNQALAIAYTPNGEEIQDLSDDPTDLTSDDDATIGTFESGEAEIGLAKALTSVSTSEDDPNLMVLNFQFRIENTGNLLIDQIQLSDYFQGQFGLENIAYFTPLESLAQITNSTATQDPTINAFFNGSSSTNILTGNDGILDVGESITISLSVMINALEVNIPLENIAYASAQSPSGEEVNDISTNGFDPDPDNNGPGDNSTPTSIPLNFADLRIEKVSDADIVSVGDQVTYTISIFNDGPDQATNVEVIDYLPYGLNYTGYESSQGNYNPGTGLWNVGIVNVSPVPVTLSITAEVGNSGSITNQAFISSSNQGDPDPNDNQAEAVIEGVEVDLSINKTVSDESPNVNEEFTYTISVSNLGTANATNILVTDVLDENLTFVSASDISYNPMIGDYVWNIPLLAGGQSISLEIVAMLNTTEVITNSVSMTADQSDPDNSNNVDEVSVNGEAADLVIIKSVDNEEPNLGDEVVFTIQIDNNGPAHASNIAIEEILPNGLDYINHDETSGSYNPSTGIWNLNSLNNGATAFLEITTHVSLVESMTNTASIISSDQFDPNLEDNQDEVVINTQIVDLVMDKTVSPTVSAIGEIVEFQIHITNQGPSVATNVVVTDNLPESFLYESSEATEGYYVAGTGIWTISNIAPNSTETLSIWVMVDELGTLTNTAHIINIDQADSNTDNNEDSATLQSNPIADLELIKNVYPTYVNLGDETVFTIIVNNLGPDEANDIIVSDLLPDGLDYITAGGSTGTYDPASGEWYIPQLINGGSATLELYVEVESSDPITNTAYITATNQYDPNTANNQDSATVETTKADLIITKEANTDVALLGEQVSFIIMVHNDGPDTAEDVEVLELLPPGLEYVDHSNSNGVYNQATGIWSIGTIESGQAWSLEIITNATEIGNLINTATITNSSVPDWNDNNDTASADLEVIEPTANLAITKQSIGYEFVVGEEVEYMISVVNVGPQSATNVEILELLPASLQYVSSDTDDGVYNPNTGIWSIEEIVYGDIMYLSLIATVEAPGITTNTVEIVSSDLTDPDLENNTDSAEIFGTVLYADLALDKTANVEYAYVGDTIIYTLTVANNGPNTATNVIVTDELPSEVLCVSTSDESYDPYNGDFYWNIDELGIGNSTTLSISVIAQEEGLIINTATISASDQLDPDYGNNDGGAKVTVSPQVGNSPPLCNDDVSITGCDPVSIFVLNNDLDPDGDVLTICNHSLPLSGTITSTINGFIYTPDSEFVGTDSFSYTVCDSNGLSCTSTVTILVDCSSDNNNNIPDCPMENINLCTEMMSPVVICPDWCLEGDLQISDVETTFNCSITMLENGCISYLPLPAFEGIEEIVITACVEDICTSASVWVEVAPSCDNTPPIANDDTANSEEGGVSIVVLINDSDPDGGSIYVCDYSQPANGYVSFNGDIANYTPYANFSGLDSFTYTICDENGNQDTATVIIHVESCINAPVCTPPQTPINICVDFCGIENPQIVTVSSIYECSVHTTSNTCFTYIGMPLFEGTEVVDVIACNDAGVCVTESITIVVGDCDSPGYLEDGSGKAAIDIPQEEDCTPRVIKQALGSQSDVLIIDGLDECQWNDTRLSIFDEYGRLVYHQIVNDRPIRWNGQNQLGINLPIGIYFYRLTNDKGDILKGRVIK